MNYKIICTHGHYEVYDDNGNFICSGDTEREVKEEIQQKGK